MGVYIICMRISRSFRMYKFITAILSFVKLKTIFVFFSQRTFVPLNKLLTLTTTNLNELH